MRPELEDTVGESLEGRDPSLSRSQSLTGNTAIEALPPVQDLEAAAHTASVPRPEKNEFEEFEGRTLQLIRQQYP